MLFRPELVAKILAGEKTQTRRDFRRETDFTYTPHDRESWRFEFTDGECVERIGGWDRDRYRVGQTFALQPGRGKHGVGRITITEIRYCSRVSDISEGDARAEGFDSPEAFRETWVRIHGGRFGSLDEPCWALTFAMVTQGDTPQLVRKDHTRNRL